jgi:DNA polymerase-1
MILVVDGTNLAHRAYHALKNTRDGIPVSASGVPIASCSSVLRSLLAAVKEHQATHLAVAFDNDQPTFRHELYPDYKKGRKEKEPTLIADIQVLQTLLIESGIGITAPIGYEAGDVIATLNELAHDRRTLIYSSDRDLWQLIDETTKVLSPGKGEIKSSGVQEMWGIKATQVVDYKALKGDTTDTIPGVRGIGEKMALELLTQYESIEDIYAHIGEITGRPYTLLKPNQADAQLSKHLATLVRDVPIDRTLDSFGIEQFQVSGMVEKLAELGLSKLAKSYKDYFKVA